ASTRVPTAVAIEAAVAQSMGPILARPSGTRPTRPPVRLIPAFDVRSIPVNERRLGGAVRLHRSGVRYPLDPGE
ncbi:MAG TPA: hypothetical protein VGQ80_04370, partial [Acidimicrobiia bacterium]|nr:hypothetical protein [Acidimicrobiia bacterium]